MSYSIKDIEERPHYMYYLMKSRTKRKGFLTIVSKQYFIEFIKSSKIYYELFLNWKNSGYKLGLTPTVDRIDNQKGYVENNLQILTYTDNQSKGSKETKTGKNKKGLVFNLKHTKTGEEKNFKSGTLARKFLGLPKTMFYSYAKDLKTYNDWLISYGVEV